MNERDYVVYLASDGTYYTDWQRRRALASGHWHACLWTEDGSRHLVETATGDALFLVRTDPRTLPAWISLHSDGKRTHTVDTRAGHPARATTSPRD